jgi:hypothetical protein
MCLIAVFNSTDTREYGLSVKNADISTQQIHWCENLADLFTKSISSRIIKQLIQKIGRRLLRDGCMVEGEK